MDDLSRNTQAAQDAVRVAVEAYLESISVSKKVRVEIDPTDEAKVTIHLEEFVQ